MIKELESTLPHTPWKLRPENPPPAPFSPIRESGASQAPGISQINDHLWEGRYSPIWPDGKKHARNVYAQTREECEEVLANLIQQMKAEIAGEKERLKPKSELRRNKASGDKRSRGQFLSVCGWLCGQTQNRLFYHGDKVP